MTKLERKSLIFVLIGMIAITSCSGDQQGAINLTEKTSKFISGNGNIVLFGKADLKGMLDKTNYKQKDSKVDALISSEILSLERVLNLKQSIYYAVEGPMAYDGTPKATYLFLEATSDTAFINELNSRGYLVEKTDDFVYTENGDFAMGVKDQLVFAVVKGGQSEAKKDLKKIRNELMADPAGGKIDKILGQDADMVIGTNLENLYMTSSTELEKLENKKKEELKKMVSDSYIQTTFKFEDGAAEIEAKNMFSESLMAIMPFNTNSSDNLFSKVNKGSGEPLAGFAMDMDVTKMEKFVNNYSPETMEMLFQSFGFAGNMFGGLPLASMITTGKVVGLATSDPVNNAMHMNVFVGLSKLGSELGKDQIEKMDLGEYLLVSQDKDGLIASISTMGKSDKSKKILLPEACEDFGKKGISVFLYLDNVNMEDFGMYGSFEMLEDLKYIVFNADNDGAKLTIKSKNEDVNILENSMDVVLGMIQNEVTLLNM